MHSNKVYVNTYKVISKENNTLARKTKQKRFKTFQLLMSIHFGSTPSNFREAIIEVNITFEKTLLGWEIMIITTPENDLVNNSLAYR